MFAVLANTVMAWATIALTVGTLTLCVLTWRVLR